LLYNNIVNTTVTTINAPAAILVAFCSVSIRVLALFLPKKVSAPPAIEPDRPALFPDWSKTAAINISSTITNITH